MAAISARTRTTGNEMRRALTWLLLVSALLISGMIVLVSLRTVTEAQTSGSLFNDLTGILFFVVVPGAVLASAVIEGFSFARAGCARLAAAVALLAATALVLVSYGLHGLLWGEVPVISYVTGLLSLALASYTAWTGLRRPPGTTTTP